MYRTVVVVLLLLGVILVPYCVRGPPVVDKKKLPADTKETEAHEQMGDEDLQNLEYNRYLQEVVNVLESHPEFKQKLESEDPEYIKSGKIAEHLDEMIPTDLRDKLSEIKLKEIERLRELYRKKIELEGAQGIQPPEHIDHSNLNTFEAEDLKKLIQKTTSDLEALDRRREEEFKQYEMKKELDRRHKLAGAKTDEHRQKMQKEYQHKEEVHKKHPKLHHPGSKDQLEEVWEEADEMPKDNFDPKTFFYLHDLDGNGHWDEHELNALFQKELDKVYNDSDPNDDPRERIEEMERMKVHVIKQMDKNEDRFISLDEFLQDTQTDDYKKDEGWDTLDQKDVYTPEEYKRYQEEMARKRGWEMPDGGYPDFYPPEGYVGQPQAGQAQQHQGQVHPGQVHPGQVHPGQVHPGQVHPGQVHPGQVHPGQGDPSQIHPGQVHPGQVPVHPAQVPDHLAQQQQIHQGQQVPVHPGQAQMHPDPQLVPVHPGQGHGARVHPGQAVPHQGEVPVHPGQAQPHIPPPGQPHPGAQGQAGPVHH